MMTAARSVRFRSASEPAISLRVKCASFTRERKRESDTGYEKGKDSLAHCIGAWSSEEVCSVLQSLVSRCSLPLLDFLWTAMESVPHRDFIAQAQTKHPSSAPAFLPLSTPLSREVRVRLNRSRRPQNKTLFRMKSAVIYSELGSTARQNPQNVHMRSESQLEGMYSLTEATPSSRLPGLQPLTPRHPRAHTPHASTRSCTPICPPVAQSRASTRSSVGRTLSTPPTRIPTPMRRHMQSLPLQPLVSSLDSATPTPNATPTLIPHPSRQSFVDTTLTAVGKPLSMAAIQCLTWFSSLLEFWQQEEVLQLIVWNLDERELYFLAVLLKSRHYRDYIAQLPEFVSFGILSFVPPKEILRHCCRVSKSWSQRCSREPLWEGHCRHSRLGLPHRGFLTWKGLFLDDLRLKRNWQRGRCTTRLLHGHSSRVLSVRIRGSLAATGSADSTAKVWNVETGDCLQTLAGHQKSVWSVCFYGKNLLITGSGDNSVKIWNYRTGVNERTLEGHSGTVWTLQQKGELLVSGSHDKTVSIP